MRTFYKVLGSRVLCGLSFFFEKKETSYNNWSLLLKDNEDLLAISAKGAGIENIFLRK